METTETTNQQPTPTPTGANHTTGAAAPQTPPTGAPGYTGQYAQNAQHTQSAQYSAPYGGGQTPPPQPPRAPQPPQKIRRVGTLALALVLIAGGVLLLLHTFLPALDLTAVLRFSPIILIVLGVEVLVYAIRPDVKLKYDFVSMFVCFVLLCGIGCASVASEFLRYYTPDNLERRATLESTLNTQAADAIAAIPGMRETVRDATVYVDYSYDNAAALAAGANNTELYVTMQRDAYPDAAAYAAACRAIMDGCKATGLDFGGYRFDTWYGGEETEMLTYSLTAESPWVIGASEAELATQVVSTYWYDGEAFDNEQARAAYRQGQAEDGDWQVQPALPATAEASATPETATAS